MHLLCDIKMKVSVLCEPEKHHATGFQTEVEMPNCSKAYAQRSHLARTKSEVRHTKMETGVVFNICNGWGKPESRKQHTCFSISQPHLTSIVLKPGARPATSPCTSQSWLQSWEIHGQPWRHTQHDPCHETSLPAFIPSMMLAPMGTRDLSETP